MKDVLVCMSPPSESLDKTGVEAAHPYHLDEAARSIVSCGDLRFTHAPEYGWHQRPNKLALVAQVVTLCSMLGKCVGAVCEYGTE